MKAFDFFGIPFNLNTDKNPTFKSNVGGFLSIMAISISLILSYFFGHDFWYRVNPKVLVQNKRGSNQIFDNFVPKNKEFHIMFNFQSSTTDEVIPIETLNNIFDINVKYVSVNYVDGSYVSDTSIRYKPV